MEQSIQPGIFKQASGAENVRKVFLNKMMAKVAGGEKQELVRRKALTQGIVEAEELFPILGGHNVRMVLFETGFHCISQASWNSCAQAIILPLPLELQGLQVCTTLLCQPLFLMDHMSQHSGVLQPRLWFITTAQHVKWYFSTLKPKDHFLSTDSIEFFYFQGVESNKHLSTFESQTFTYGYCYNKQTLKKKKPVTY